MICVSHAKDTETRTKQSIELLSVIKGLITLNIFLYSCPVVIQSPCQSRDLNFIWNTIPAVRERSCPCGDPGHPCCGRQPKAVPSWRSEPIRRGSVPQLCAVLERVTGVAELWQVEGGRDFQMVHRAGPGQGFPLVIPEESSRAFCCPLFRACFRPVRTLIPTLRASTYGSIRVNCWLPFDK